MHTFFITNASSNIRKRSAINFPSFQASYLSALIFQGQDLWWMLSVGCKRNIPYNSRRWIRVCCHELCLFIILVFTLCFSAALNKFVQYYPKETLKLNNLKIQFLPKFVFHFFRLSATFSDQYSPLCYWGYILCQ